MDFCFEKSNYIMEERLKFAFAFTILMVNKIMASSV